MDYVEKPCDIDTLRDALAQLTPDDLEKYQRDLVAFGRAMVKHLDDGRVVYIPPDEWVTSAQSPIT